jgi:dsRNA-specific ribonuclease
MQFTARWRDTTPIKIHTSDNILENDGNIHVYYTQPSSVQGDIYVFEYEGTYSHPKFLYVREGLGRLDQLKDLTIFLKKRLYRLNNAEEEELHLSSGNSAFKNFASEIIEKTSDSLEKYIREILISIRKGEATTKHNTFPELTDGIIEKVAGYSNIFHAALTDQDIDSNPRSNYELLEFMGDLVSWKPLTNIFLEYAKAKDIEMTEQVITAMHRSFASKEKQSEISKQLGLHIYLRKKGEVTIDTYEDIFESMVGAFYFVSFLIRSLLSIDLQLHERFLRWIYQGWDLSSYEIKPEITKFYEYMRVLCGRSAFREKENVNKWFMRYDPGTEDEILERLLEYTDNHEKTKQDVEALFRLIKVPYDTVAQYSARTRKYAEINKFIETRFTARVINHMSNMRNTADWDEDVKGEIKRHVDFFKQSIIQRFTDKSRTYYHWIVEDENKNTLYSTMDHNDPEDPATLLMVINTTLEGNATTTASAVYVPYELGHGSYLLTGTGEKFFLRGPPSIVEDEVMKHYKEGTGQFYIVVRNESDGSSVAEIEYNLSSSSFISNPSKLENIRRFIIEEQEERLLSVLEEKKNSFSEGKISEEEVDLAQVAVENMEEGIFDETEQEYSMPVIRYIGDRAAYSTMTDIAIFSHSIENVHHLTEVRNFYRSKLLKRYISEILDFRSKDGKLLELDHIIGLNLDIAERVILFIYRHVIIKPKIIYRSESRIKSLRLSLFARADARIAGSAKTRLQRGGASTETYNLTERERVLKREHMQKSSIRSVGGRYVYEMSNGAEISVPIIGLNNERIRTVFADYILEQEKKLNPNHNTIRNYRFSSMQGFDTLCHAMEFRNVSEWQLFRNKRGALELRYFTENDEEVIYISGGDIDGINKHL